MMQTLAAAAALVLGHPDAAQPAETQWQQAESQLQSVEADIVVEAPLLYPSVGLNNDHLHKGGEFMIGLRFERSRWSGLSRRGTDNVPDEGILAVGYASRTRRMTMDMAMLDLMYAPSDTITLMLMPHYMWHRMEMVGIDPSGGGGAGHGGHGTHGIGFGEVHKHRVSGLGDTLASASMRLAASARFNSHFTLGVWLPTGEADRRNPDGSFVHYGMQPGSGTWDVEPSLTFSGTSHGLRWGMQASYRWRVSEANGSGFRFGDRMRLSAWVSRPISPTVAATARLEYAREGMVEGHYNGPHAHLSPPDRQENYGGKVISAALGMTWQPPPRSTFRPELGVEVAIPIYQKPFGIQVPHDWRVATAIRQTF